MFREILTLVCATMFVSSCALTPVDPKFPSCPTDTGHFFDYLECAWPYEKDAGEDNLTMARAVTAYCKEEVKDWLPVLDRGVKKSSRELREYGEAKLESEMIQDKLNLTEEEWDDYPIEDLFAATLAVYVMGPAMAGFFGQTDSCVELFQYIESEGFIEQLEKWEKE